MHHLMDSLSHLNWLAVLTAAVASFAIGGLWYSPLLFAKLWMRETNITPENAKGSNIPLIFGTTFVLQIIAAIGLALVTEHSNVSQGALRGLMIGVVWVATAIGTNYLYERKSLLLFFINVGYSVVLLTVMGAILGAWH
jgi:hypothetical protein